jgi:hypothetical protein
MPAIEPSSGGVHLSRRAARRSKHGARCQTSHPTNDGRVPARGMNTMTTVAAEAATAVAKVHPGRLASSLVIFAAGVDRTKRQVVLCDLVEAGRLPFLIWDAIFVSAGRYGRGGLARSGGWLDCWRCDPAKDFPGYAAGREGAAAADCLAGARWARRVGGRGGPHTRRSAVTRLHQFIEVAL